MLKRILSTVMAALACLAVNAQGVCVINGTIDDIRLKDGKKVKTVCLNRIDALGRTVKVDEVKVKKGRYAFNAYLPLSFS